MPEQYNNPNFFTEYADNVKSQFEDAVLLLRLKAVKIATKLLTKIAMFAAIILFGFFVFLFFNVILAFYLSELLNSYYYGFGIVGSVYFLLLIICIVFRQAIFGRFVMNGISDAVFDKTEKIDDNGK